MYFKLATRNLKKSLRDYTIYFLTLVFGVCIFYTFNSIESQKIFLDMLDKAEKEVGFVTDDYKVMIEALFMSNGNFVLTVTRFEPEKANSIYKKKKVSIKRKICELKKKRKKRIGD